VLSAVWQIGLAVIALKVIVLAIDPTIRLYLGDSTAYLAGAIDSHRLPSDRSFVYSLLIRALVRPFESLWPLLVWQTVAGAGIALVVWWMLARRFAIPPALAFIAACALAIEPAQLYYERMVMAETIGLLAFVAFIAASSAYLASGRLLWLPTVALLGLAAVSLRLNYLPIVLVISIALPLVRLVERARPNWKLALAHSAVALCSVAVMHTAYRYTVAVIYDVPPGYLGRAGFMRLGLVAPLVKPEHFERVGLPSDLPTQLKYPLRDPYARMSHMWAPGGLVRELARRKVDVERTARDLSRMALEDDSFGLVRLGLHMVGDYFRPERSRLTLNDDLGRRRIPDDDLWNLREHWNYDATGLPTRVTPVHSYFEASAWWLVACLCLMVPLSALNVIVHWRAPERPHAVLFALVGVGLVLAHVLFVNVASYRYLHPMPVFLMLNALPLFSRAARFSRARRSSHQ
jgi:hypothetical protein